MYCLAWLLDLFSVCFQIVFASAISEGDVCTGIKNKLDRESNVFIYYKLITGLRKVTNVHFPYLCLLTSQE